MRARHVVEEINRTNRAVWLLESGDVEGLGQLMNACHISLRDLYQGSCPELDVMVKIAQTIGGCYRARLTWGGVGGYMVNLVSLIKAELFTKSLSAKYEAATWLHLDIFTCRASPGAGLI